MIKINLLRKEEIAPKVKKPAGFMIYVLLAALAAFIAMGLATFYVNSKKEALQLTFENNKRQIAELQKKINETKKFEELNNELGKRKTLIETLRKNQSIPVMILDEVSSLLPAGIWLTNLTYSGNIVNVEGFGFTNSEIVTYVDSLKLSAYFSDVYLEETKQTQVEKVDTYKFKLNFRIKG
ncbi:MAG: PilN domain-containing protein [Dissulfurispiraceae bacterium]|jgi:type IV pilus assembly protein PilN|nr:PilN domain-containing protein [Dissulfurispiraceae bacterium]